MTSTHSRTKKIADLMQRELALLLHQQVRDPRFAGVTVTAVEVTRDLSYAKVFVTVLAEDEVKETVKALNKAAGFLRSQLSQVMQLRTTPKLNFVYDASVIKGQKLSALIDKANKDNQA